MLKKVVLKLENIKYSGDSVGEDIRLEIEILGKFFNFGKRLKSGSNNKLDNVIGEFDTDRKIFTADINLRIIEDDPIFNDVGSINKEIKIDTTKASGQEFKYEIEIQEWRATMTRAKAVFTLTLEAEVLESETYLFENSDGWVKSKIDGKGEASLPAFLRINFIRTDGARDYFKIMEGPYRGKNASLPRQKDQTSYLLSGVVKREVDVRAIYSISKKIFTLNEKKYSAIDDPEMRLKKGIYDIEIPDYPHGRSGAYLEAGKPQVWFKIGHSGDRYLHVGARSLGCMTIIETRRWPEIYNYLIKARKGDSLSVGVVEVID